MNLREAFDREWDRITADEISGRITIAEAEWQLRELEQDYRRGTGKQPPKALPKSRWDYREDAAEERKERW